MNQIKLFPVFIFAAIVIGVGIACNLTAGATKEAPTSPSEQPTAAVLPQATDTSLPESSATSAPVLPTKVPPPTATAAPEKFFTEEFNSDPGANWGFFVIRGNKTSDRSKATTEFSGGQMIFDIEDTELYAYYLYQPISYTDVRLDVQAENQGKNTNNISLVCRQDSNTWYEFSITSGGLWVLYAHTNNGYDWMANGGTRALNMGKDVNEFSMICQGNTITMLVNGTTLKTITDKKYKYKSGAIGFNVSSLDVIPVVVGVDWMKISQP